MAFNVRIFAHEGLAQQRLILPFQHTERSVFQLTQPYLWSQVISTSGVVVSSSPDNTPRVSVLRIEVPDRERIFYEINPPSRTVIASVTSPLMSGCNNFPFAPGWTISMGDASTAGIGYFIIGVSGIGIGAIG